MTQNLERVNFWRHQLPYDIYRSDQRVLAKNGLMKRSKINSSHANNLTVVSQGNVFRNNINLGKCILQISRLYLLPLLVVLKRV